MRPPGSTRQLLRLVGVRLRALLNVAQDGGARVALLGAAALFLVGALVYGEYRFFLRVFTMLGRQEDIPRFVVIGVLGRLHNMIFLTAFSMMLFSNVLTSVSTTYMATDLPLLHSAPIRRGTVFAVKTLEALLLASYMVWLVTLPIFVAFGAAYGSAASTAAAAAPILFLFSLPPSLLGALAALVLMRFVPARRAHQVLTALGLFAAVILLVLLRSLRPERLLDPGSADDLVALLARIEIPEAWLLPSTWAANGIVGALEGLGAGSGREAAKLALLSLPIAAVLALVVEAGYGRAFSRSGEGMPIASARAGGGLPDRLLRLLFRGASREGRALYVKDIRNFGRDSLQWSQLLLVGALIVVYLFNIRNLPFVAEMPMLRVVIGYLNIGLMGFILSAISVRYAFPAVSLEGRAFWVIRTSPIDFRRLVLSKLVLHAVPFLLLAETMVTLGHFMLGLGNDVFMLRLSLGTTALMTFGLTGLGVGMGALFPQFRWESPAQIAAGAAGIAYMTISLAFVAACVALLFVPVYHHMIALSPRWELERLSRLPVLPFYGGLVALSLLVGALPVHLGIERLRTPRD